MTGEWDSGVKGTAWALSPLTPSPTRGPLSPVCCGAGGARSMLGEGQADRLWAELGKDGLPGGRQPHILSCLGIVCFSRIPRTGKVTVGIQGGAAHPCMAQSQACARAGQPGRTPGLCLHSALNSLCALGANPCPSLSTRLDNEKRVHVNMTSTNARGRDCQNPSPSPRDTSESVTEWLWMGPLPSLTHLSLS